MQLSRVCLNRDLSGTLRRTLRTLCRNGLIPIQCAIKCGTKVGEGRVLKQALSGRKSRAATCSALMMVALIANTEPLTSASATPGANIEVTLAKLPLRFEANCGQTDPVVKFLARGRGASLFLNEDEIMLSLDP